MEPHQNVVDQIVILIAQHFQRDAGDGIGFYFALCLFLDIFFQVGGLIAKGFVLGEFCLSSRDQLIMIRHIMNVGGGITSTL